MARLAVVPAWVGLIALVLVSSLLRLLASLPLPGPWIAPDEMVYGLLGRGLYERGELEILSGPTPFVSLVYPALVGLPLALDDLEHGYALLKALQAVVMSAAAIPVFLWGRELMAERWALAAAALTVAIPGLAYSGLIMSEVAYYPLAVVACWAIARVLVAPTRARQMLLVAALVAAAATRVQAVALVPTLVTALGVYRVLGGRVTLRRLAPTGAALCAAALAWTLWQAGNAGSWTKLLGVYAAAGETSYSLRDALVWTAHHASAAALFTAVAPASALVLLVAGAARRRDLPPPQTAFLAVTVSYSLWLVVEVGVFASRHILRVAERDLLTLAPLLFLALVLWLARGAPRPRLAAGVTALAVAGLALAIPERHLTGAAAVPDAPTLAALRELSGFPDVDVPVYVAMLVFGGALLFALVPRRLLPLLPAVLVATFAGLSYAASTEFADRGHAFRSQLVGGDPRWIDVAADAPVAYVYDGDRNWNAVWAHAFWNRRVEQVLDLPRALVPGPLPQTRLRRRPDGRLVRLDAAPITTRYVVAGAALELLGTRVRTVRQPGAHHGAVVLWRVAEPLRLSHTRTGVEANGDMYGAARLTVYACGRGVFRLTLIAKEARRVEVRRDGRRVNVVRFKTSDETWSAEIPAPADANGRGACTLELRPDAFLGSTRFEFVRSD